MKRYSRDKLAAKLIRYFISSTFIPFLLIVTISASLMDYHYKQDILLVTDGYLESLATNVSLYIKDLQQVALLPYFSNEVMTQIQRLSKEDSISFSEQARLDSALDSLLSSVRYTRNDFYSALIVKDQNVLYSSSNYINSIPIPDYDWAKEPWYQEAIEAEGKAVFMPPHVPDYYDFTDQKERFSYIGTIRNLLTREPYAVIKIDALTSSFDRFLKNMDFHAPSCIYITDQANRLIYIAASEPSMLNQLDIIMTGEHEQKLAQETRSSSHIEKPIKNTDYTLHIILDSFTIWFKSARIYFIGIILYVIAFLTALFLNKRFSRRITDPIAQLRSVLASVEKGDFSVRYLPEPQWELQELGLRVNQMIEELNKTIQRTYVAQLAQREAENRALLSQIQPHFLFNTINGLIALTYDQDISKLETGLFGLSDMLHYVLRKEETVTLREELKFIADYLLLQQIRHSEKLLYKITVDSASEHIVVPRLILQPFVENAIIHGIEPKTEASHIEIRVYIANQATVISLQDDGVGFDESTTDVMSSVGIANCVHRLSLLYPDSSIDIASSIHRGCTVVITIPNTSKDTI
ncbi:MAG: sensor histidine kinase [Sphaerochaetaceae bacterium]|nr:sensor histidine kinase [uncultured Sphaerochaeta sp.]MDC7229634.1 sensor histidine kinase [Sphaerochaetaceae bacterium]